MTYSAGRDFTRAMPLLLAAALAAAGILHLLVLPEHIAMSPLFGAGFLAAAAAELGMAALAALRPSRALFVAVIGVTVVLMSLYAYNVVVGLPFSHDTTAASADSHEPPHEHASGAADAADAGVEEGDAEHGAEPNHHAGGLHLGAGEPVDAYGALTQLAQVSAAALALALLVVGRKGSQPSAE